MEYKYELYHHGTKGMKWGIRRYQNKDGSLTPAGKKRYNQEMEKLQAEEKVLKTRKRTQAKIDKLEEKRKSNEALRKSLEGKTEDNDVETVAKEPAKKTAKTMSDTELRDAVLRLTMEKQYSELTPAQTSRGKQFVEGMWDKAVQPALQNVAKTQIEKYLNDSISKLGKTK